ncbi:transcription factor GTE4 isoform X2 [Mangifera indica]|uniref:transcription factor GTE4 isoform X2 n=1 Tax=Mangifera indica TaxID=29780 RepID=UPI001CFB78A3|nr:transcription factor GTE4 isoform X2 [Mangifera indica]
MASGPIVGGADGTDREKQRYSESKVYTRKAFKGPKNQNNNTATNNSTSAPTITAAPAETTTTATVPTTTSPTAATTTAPATTTTTTATTVTTKVTPNDDNNQNNESKNISNSKDESNDEENKSNNNEGKSNNEENKSDNNEGKSNNEENNMDESNNDNNKGENNGNAKSSIQEVPTQTLALESTSSAQQQLISRLDAVLDDFPCLNTQQVVSSITRELAPLGNGGVKLGLENKVKINFRSSSKQEMRQIMRKLEGELDTVRSLVKRIEAKEGQISGGFSNLLLPLAVNDGVDNGVKRVYSEVASVGVSVPHRTISISRQARPLNQLSISTLENGQALSERVEKEKRTPKANQFYRNSEFLLAKDKFPPAESNKKSKLNGKKQAGRELVHGFGPGSKVFKNCSHLLERLMKHKHGWVFNTPVDVKGLGLHDYFAIIKHPMDLGTVKSRLNKNWYKTPKEFAEDVRLTFHNAMTYNPKGQDVHVMAEQLLKIFEEKWAVIESEYHREMRIGADYEMSFHTPTLRKAPPLPHPLDMRRILDRSESMTYPTDPKTKPISLTPSGRTPTPKKPKAKDPHKRDMSYEEKQKLSTNLQSLPSEKLDNIVQIIKKRNSSLFQHDDEIEVDIDSVDAETLWELDRFVTNYKKSLSKNKRKAELAIQARAGAQQIVQQASVPVVAEVPKEIRTDEKKASSSSPVQVENKGNNGSMSSSSSSSSSDSGSSSSDSDSETSSSGSDGRNSPRT